MGEGLAMRNRIAQMWASRLLLILVGLSVAVGGAQATTTQSFTGDLRADATFQSCGTGCTLGVGNSDSDYAQWAAVQRNFIVAAPSTVQAVTFSYGGGTNGNNQTIVPDGFEPYLSLFDSSGTFLSSTFFGVTCPPGANTNAGSGQCYDVLLDAGLLAPGNYIITISAFENMSFAENSGAGTLADGFTGLGNLAFGEDMHYAFDVVIQQTSQVPEPSTFSFVGYASLISSVAAGARRKLRRS
jgi:hypothetical protein